MFLITYFLWNFNIMQAVQINLLVKRHEMMMFPLDVIQITSLKRFTTQSAPTVATLPSPTSCCHASPSTEPR